MFIECNSNKRTIFTNNWPYKSGVNSRITVRNQNASDWNLFKFKNRRKACARLAGVGRNVRHYWLVERQSRQEADLSALRFSGAKWRKILLRRVEENRIKNLRLSQHCTTILVRKLYYSSSNTSTKKQYTEPTPKHIKPGKYSA